MRESGHGNVRRELRVGFYCSAVNEGVFSVWRGGGGARGCGGAGEG